MYNENLQKFIEQIKQKNIGMNRVVNECGMEKDKSVVEQVADESAYETKKSEKGQYLYEDTSKRTSNSRSYRSVKGKTETVISGVPVNYLDLISRKYRPIDNTLEKRNDGEFVGYENRSNSFKVRFAESTANADLMRIEKDGYELYIRLLTQDVRVRRNGVAGRRHNDVSAMIKSARSKRDANVSEIGYAGLYDDVDFDYEVRQNSIKENITVRARKESYAFAYKIYAKDLELREKEEGREIEFIATVSRNNIQEGDVVFTMPAAYMYDANKSTSYDVSYELQPVGEKEYVLKVVPDEEWINSEERIFPVVIDPNILVAADKDDELVYRVVLDNENYSAASRFYAEQNGTVRLGYQNIETLDCGESELYIGLKNRESLLAGLTDSLKIIIPLKGSPDCDNIETGGYFEVHGVTEQGWMDRELSWDARPETSSKIIAFAKPVADEGLAEDEDREQKEVGGEYGYSLTFEIAPALASKYTGFAVKASHGTDCYKAGLSNSVSIPSVAMKSQIEVRATSNAKEDVYGGKSIQQSCNLAGTGAIDLFTGDITFVHEDVNWEGVQVPMGVSHIYNTRYYDREADETYKCGVGWRLSILQTLKEDTDAEGGDGFKSYIYTDASGIRQTICTRYYKNCTSDDGTRKYKIYGTDKSGCNGEEVSNGTYTLTSSSSQNILTDKAGNKLKFNISDGRLVEMETADGLELKITYKADSIDVADFNGRKLTLEFSGNKLQNIKSNGSLIRSYSYKTVNSKNCLSTIESYFGASNFAYNSSGYLYKVTDPSKYIVEYKIDAGNDHLCTGYKIKSKAKEISYDIKENLGVTEFAVEQELDDITVAYNAKFSENMYDGRFWMFYFSYYMENMTIVKNKSGAAEFFKFSPDGTLQFALDDKCNQQVNYLNIETTELDSDKNWNNTKTTNITANALHTARIVAGGDFSRWPVSDENNDIINLSVNHLCGTCTGLEKGSYIFTAVIFGNVLSDSSSQSENTSYVAVRVVRHLSGGSTDEYSVRLDPNTAENTEENLASVPFFVDDNVTSVDMYVDIRNNPEFISISYWDVIPAANGTMVVSKDNDYSETTAYNGKFCTTTKSDLSKRTDKTKQTATKRKSSGKSITSQVTYKSATSEKVLNQDDGISLKKSYTYDIYGNVTSEEVVSRIDSALKMKRTYSYLKSSSDMNRNALFTEYDENGNAIKYEYGSYGHLSDVITPVDSQDIYYHYENDADYGSSDGVLGAVYARESANVEETHNELHYNVGYLTRVSHSGTAYNISYDGFGRMTKVSIGSTVFIESFYTDNGTNIDGVQGATNKVVTSYNRRGSVVNRLCGSALCGQAIVTPAYDQNGLYNDVYASYYNYRGELIEMRHAFGHDPQEPFGSEDNYLTVMYDRMHSGLYSPTTYYYGNEKKYVYNYDRITGELHDVAEYDNNELKIKYENKTADAFGRSSGAKFTLDNNETLEYTYVYKSDYEDSIKTVTLPSDKKSTVETDAFGRIESRTLNTPAVIKSSYEYCSSEGYSGYTTPLVYKETLKSGSSTEAYKYEYDANNNITQIRDSNDKLVASYQYDGLNRLIRENIVGGNTTVFKYDVGGNIQFKKVYTYSAANGKTITELLEGTAGKTKSYGYTIAVNEDLLSSYNGSEELSYDNCGLPVMWFKHGQSSSTLNYILQWIDLRLTAVTDISSGDMYYYKYNDRGIRTEKKVEGVTHKYYLQDEKIIAEKVGEKYLKFYYDTSGVCGFNYDNKDYYYLKNLFGDIIKIIDENGTLYAEYSYDAWGKCTIKSNVNGIAKINPFRYRGYYYDEEISLYYLNSRYYDPEIGRFISADAIDYLAPETINGIDLYAYCNNNPVMNTDPSGRAWWQIFVSVLIIGVAAVVAVATAGTAVGIIAAGAAIGGAVGGIAGGATGAIEAAKNGGDIFEGFANGMLSGTITGTISGAAAASPIGVWGQVGLNVAISGGEYLVNSAINNNFNPVDFVISMAAGGFGGWVGNNGLLRFGINGLKTAGNSLVKNLLVKELTIKNIAVLGKYLSPIIKSTFATVAGGIFKIFT